MIAYYVLVFVLIVIFLFGFAISFKPIAGFISERNIVIIFVVLLIFLVLAGIFFEYQKKKFPKKFIRDKDVKEIDKKEGTYTILKEIFNKERMLSRVNIPAKKLKIELRKVTIFLLIVPTLFFILLYISIKSPELFKKIMYLIEKNV
jgi:MFS family permease